MPSDEYWEAFADELRAQLADAINAPKQKGICRFNRNIDCAATGNKCGQCGWNPAVAEIRAQEIRRRLGIGNEKKS